MTGPHRLGRIHRQTIVANDGTNLVMESSIFRMILLDQKLLCCHQMGRGCLH